MTTTLRSLVNQTGVEVLKHLDESVEIPILTGLQFQGDLAIAPLCSMPGRAKAGLQPVPQEGIPVIRGENGGNTHLLLGDGSISWAAERPGMLTLGMLSVPEDSVAVLAHPEHGFNRMGPGLYKINRQREQADVERFVTD